MGKHRRATFLGKSGRSELPLTPAMSGLLVGIAILTVGLPFGLSGLADGGELVAFAPIWDRDARPGPLPAPTTSPKPSPTTPPPGENPNASGEDDEADDADEQRSAEAAPRDTPPPATKVPSSAKPGTPAAAPPAAAAPPPAAPAEPAPPAGCGDVLTCVNQLRAQYGVAPLSTHAGLTAFAQECADRGATTGVFSYSVSGPGGFSPWREHIAVGYGSAQSAVEGWMSSPTHLAALLDPAYTLSGVAVAGPSDDLWWCQELGG